MEWSSVMKQFLFKCCNKLGDKKQTLIKPSHNMLYLIPALGSTHLKNFQCCLSLLLVPQSAVWKHEMFSTVILLNVFASVLELLIVWSLPSAHPPLLFKVILIFLLIVTAEFFYHIPISSFLINCDSFLPLGKIHPFR